MLMFRSRRTALIKRLWKTRALGNEESREVTKRLLKRLNDDQLEMLAEAIESRSDSSPCLPLEDLFDEDPVQFTTCQVWRWPDLESDNELKKLPNCKPVSGNVCCNPYHWSRLCRLESPPPPYSRFYCELLKPEDRAPSESSQLELRGSFSTNGEEETGVREQWCRLAYWELSRRVGRQFEVEKPSVDVFGNLPYGEGFCLAALTAHSFSPPEVVSKARKKIGRGVTLSKEVDGVWAYNKSDCPMFVNSPALDEPGTRILMVYKVPPGHCINVYAESARMRTRSVCRPHIGPVDPNSVRISFAKGWGPKYSRQEVTSCPTWLEILLAPCR